MQQDALFDDHNIDNQTKKQQTPLQTPKNKVNLLILFIYVLFMFMSSLLGSLINTNHVNNTKDLLDYNLTWEISETDDGDLLNYQGTITNTSEETIEEAYIIFDLKDSNGEILTTKKYLIVNLEGSETITINEDYEVEQLILDTDELNIDESAYHPLSVDFANLFSFLTTFVVAIALFIVNKSNYIYDFKTFKREPKKHFTYILTGFLLLYAASFTANIIMTFIGVTETSQNEMAIQRLFNPSFISLASLFLLLVIFTPIVEETVFRKALYGLSYNAFGDKGAILISGLVFAFLHVASYGDFVQVIPYAFMGLAFSYIYFYSGR
ncbi:MAG: CPBP family glutamic-type intramembrane protease, partial [Tenericutes bacterium]|nr:CPBP family glutamic-type intramembrane protease [Mycoplasmatota bacterium]